MGEYFRVTDMETRVRSVTHSIGIVIAVFVAANIVTTIGFAPLLAAGIAELPLENNPPYVTALSYVLQFLGFFLAAFAYLWWWSGDDLFDIGPPSLRDVAWIVGGFVLLYVLLQLLSAVLVAAGIDTATNEVIRQGDRNPTLFLYLLPITFLFVAPAEELVYRGIVQGQLRNAYGVIPGIVGASVLFGSTHIIALLASDGGHVASIALISVLGVALAAIYERTENLLVPIVIHGLFNATQFVIQYLVATGAVPSN